MTQEQAGTSAATVPVVLLACGHWKNHDRTVGAIYAFCAYCDRYVNVHQPSCNDVRPEATND